MLLDKDPPRPALGFKEGLLEVMSDQSLRAEGGKEGRRAFLTELGRRNGLGGQGGVRYEGVSWQALRTSARMPSPGAPPEQGAPQRPTRPPVPAAHGEAWPRAGQQEATAQPGPRAQHGCSRPPDLVPPTGREGGRPRGAGRDTDPTAGGP